MPFAYAAEMWREFLSVVSLAATLMGLLAAELCSTSMIYRLGPSSNEQELRASLGSMHAANRDCG